MIVSLSRNASARYPFGEVVFDSHDHCCKAGLACCYTGFAGTSVAIAESSKAGYAKLATVAIGDPDNIQVHVVTCDADQLSAAFQPPCRVSATVLPGYESSGSWSSGGAFAQAVGIGGFQAILVADSTQGCDYALGGCGVVCEVPSCSPGHCLTYDFSTDTDFCQKCARPHDCPGGVQTCVSEPSDTLWALALSLALFMALFVCLYALSAWARGATWLEILNEVLCCGLVAYVSRCDLVCLCVVRGGWGQGNGERRGWWGWGGKRGRLRDSWQVGTASRRTLRLRRVSL